MIELTDAQLDRYARHIVLREVGGAGQRRLLAAHVVLVGAGGIGSPAIQYLAAAGIGRLTIVDDDRVALSNLQRQTLYASRDVGAHKVAMAANAAQMLAGADVVIDGSDSFATRLAVADAALAGGIPLVSAAVGPFDGQLAVYRGWEPGRPCYRCLVGTDPAREEASCADQGVIGALTGIVGSWAALEAIRAIVPFGDDPAGRLLLIDALSMRTRTLTVPKDPACPCAG